MKNADRWTPSKFVYRGGRLMASRDRAKVRVGSRLMTDLIAAVYDTYLPQYARGRLIDLGCGRVPLFEAYRDHITDHVCVDWANTEHRNEFIDQECDLTRALPFQDGAFDTIILSDVLEHIPEPEALWREMFRILRPQGKVLMNTPFYYCLHEAPYDFYRYTEFALRRFADRTGFRILVLKPLGGAPEILADLFAKHLQFIPLIGRPCAMCVQALTRAFVQTAPGRMVSQKTTRGFPFGYFLVAEKAGG
jgi:SAM-dependent methyltransferase